MKRVSFWLTDQQIESLAELKRKTGVKLAEHIRRALDNYLRKEKGK